MSRGSISVLRAALAEFRGASTANDASKEVREDRELTSRARFFDLGCITVFDCYIVVGCFTILHIFIAVDNFTLSVAIGNPSSRAIHTFKRARAHCTRNRVRVDGGVLVLLTPARGWRNTGVGLMILLHPHIFLYSP